MKELADSLVGALATVPVLRVFLNRITLSRAASGRGVHPAGRHTDAGLTSLRDIGNADPLLS